MAYRHTFDTYLQLHFRPFAHMHKLMVPNKRESSHCQCHFLQLQRSDILVITTLSMSLQLSPDFNLGGMCMRMLPLVDELSAFSPALFPFVQNH